jgi:transposase
VAGKSKYPEQFRRDAVDLVRSSGRPLRQVARELGVNHETLRVWVAAAQAADERRGGDELSVSEREELRRLRKQVAELELEKQILRRAAAYFAKEMNQ